MSNPFLPDGYNVPKKAGKFLSLKQGENRLRVLASPVLGTLAWRWKDDTKQKTTPVRVPQDQQLPPDIIADSKHFPKHWWALPVWNYDEKRVQIWEITQSTIQDTLTKLAQDEDWGSPLQYDIAVTRTGEKLDTEYSVIAKPKSELPDDVKDAWMKVQETFNLQAMFEGKDPFGKPDQGDEDGTDYNQFM